MSDTKLREAEFDRLAAEFAAAHVQRPAGFGRNSRTEAAYVALRTFAFAEAPSEAQPALSVHDAMLICNTHRVSMHVVRAIEAKLGRDLTRLAQPAPKAPETLPSDATLDQLRELGAWAYQRDLKDEMFRERARLILKAAQADQPKGDA